MLNPVHHTAVRVPGASVAMQPGPVAMGSLPPPSGAGAVPSPMAGLYMAVPTSAEATYTDSFDTLMKNKGLYVKEQVNIGEVLTGCDMEHNFAVSSWDPAIGASRPKDGKGPEVMYMKEVSPCLERIVCGANRSFKIGVVPSSTSIGTFHPGFQSRDAMFSHPDGFVVDRPFRCTLCCLNRPIVHMKHNTAGRFATVINPCKRKFLTYPLTALKKFGGHLSAYAVCSYQFDIHAAGAADGGEGTVAEAVKAEAGRKWYTVNGTMCQPGVMCPLPCGDCAKVRLQIYEGSDEALAKPIGEVARVFPGCFKSLLTDADDFTISFPGDASPYKRASLVSAVIMMNYLFYENKKNKGDEATRGLL